jgi:choline-sulfatase
MPTDPSEESAPSEHGLSRRQFVQGAAAVAAGFALPALPGAADARAEQAAEGAGRPSKRPNLLILITDQERFPRDWPGGWADEHLPNRRRLARHGLTFRRAFCSAAMCSPSRASLFTGAYPAEHGVTQVLQYGPDAIDQATLQPSRKNMATLLAAAGYDVQYRGKWHISKDPTGTLAVQSPRDLGQYGFRGWIPPDSGTDQQAQTFGGGDTHYDTQYAAQAAAFLRRADPRSARPFALIVTLVNPHDLMGYPDTWDEPSSSDIPPYQGSDNYGKYAPGCFDQGIDIPETAHEPPFGNHKPGAQGRSTIMWATGIGTLLAPRQRLDYVNFYAYLHKESDRHIGTVLDALESNSALRDKTIVIRTSDHGEMGLAHGGMREKGYNAYEETIHVPLVVANPKLFPRPVQTDALATLVDLLPTLATLGQVPRHARWAFRGRDLTPIIRDAVDHPRNPTASVQDAVLFTTDEVIGEKIVGQPSHIRCLREAEWKFAMYFDPVHEKASEYELYDLRTDPFELHNMAAPESPYYDPRKVAEMQAKLERKMIATGTVPA